jgi:hypothetical protein
MAESFPQLDLVTPGTLHITDPDGWQSQTLRDVPSRGFFIHVGLDPDVLQARQAFDRLPDPLAILLSRHRNLIESDMF